MRIPNPSYHQIVGIYRGFIRMTDDEQAAMGQEIKDFRPGWGGLVARLLATGQIGPAKGVLLTLRIMEKLLEEQEVKL